MSTAHTLARIAAPRTGTGAIKTTDEQLVAAIADGNQLAMRVLYARHNVRLYRFVLNMLRNQANAEDVVSDTFFDVWQQAGRFEGRSKVSTWLMSIARHKALTVLRSRQHEEIETYAEIIADQADTPETAMQKIDKGTLLRECLTRLTPAHREIVDLVYYQDRKIEEVAEILAIPLNTVKTRMHYARKRLAEMLAEAGYERAA